MFKFILIKHFTIKPRYLLAAFIPFVIAACNNGGTIPFPADETGFSRPVSKPFKFSEPQPLQWKQVSPDSIKPPVTKPLDIEKLPSKPFTLNDAKQLKGPVQTTKLDWDKIPDSIINLDAIPEKPFILQTSILPKASFVRIGPPKRLENTTTALLQMDEALGLPSAVITTTLKDRDGTIWIGTDKGQLCQYMGENLLVYNFVQNGAAITKIGEDKKGNLWALTSGDGIYIVDHRNSLLKHDGSNKYGLDIDFDDSGKIWVGILYEGLFVIDEEKGTSKNLRPHAKSDQENSAYALLKDHYNNIWVAFQDNVTVLDKSRKYGKRLNKSNGLNNNRILSFFEDQQGDMWIGYKGVNIISIKNNTLATINYNNGPIGLGALMQEDDHNNMWIAANDTLYILNKEKTTIRQIVTNAKTLDRLRAGMCKDMQGNIWLATLDKGILIADPKGLMPEHLDSKNGLADNNVWGMLEDKNENIWISSYKGINIYDPHKNQLKLLSKDNGTGYNGMNRLFEDGQGNIITVNATGFSIIDRNKNTIANYGKEQIRSENFTPIKGVLDSSERLWLILQQGMAIYDLKKNSLGIWNKSTGLLSDILWDIQPDRHGNLWVGLDSGLAVIDPQHNTIKYLREQDGLCNNNVAKIVVRDNGEIWVATYKGISIIDPDKFTITNLTAKEGLIPEVQYDLLEQNGKLYAGSGDGIIVITPPDTSQNATAKNKQWNFINYSKRQGFPFNDYNQATAITTKKGQSWWGVTPMLAVVTQQPVTDTVASNVYITRISIMDQYPSYFSWAAFGKHLNAGDTLWDETKKKYYLKNTLPKDSGYVFDNNIQWDSLTPVFNIPAGLTLPHDQNYLNFSFTNRDINGRDKIAYRYVLEGADKKWSDITDRPFSRNYYNLAPGKYLFKVVTRGFTGIWSKPDELSFTILSPWWKRWWAYLLYVLLAAIVVTTYARYRSRRLKQENVALENKIKQRTAELSKSLDDLKSAQAQLVQAEKMASLGELTAGIAHEIQNPLNFVNNFSEVSMELLDELDEELNKGNSEEAKIITGDIKQNLEKINHHGKRADAIVKGMLQHSRSSSGTKEPTDINALADEYLRLSYHGLRAKDKSFNAALKTNFDESLSADEAGIGKINIIPQDIGRVLLNLFNNAFYTVDEKQKAESLKPKAEGKAYEPVVTVTTRRIGSSLGDMGKISISVKDNGNGIPQKIVDKIFQPFFTTKPTGQGTGLGLSLSYDIIKAHGGEIKINTIEGEGSEFIIQLPVV